MLRKTIFLLLLLSLCSCGNDYSVCLVFDNVEGLRSNSPVMLNGLQIGDIEEMKAFPQGVYVTISVDGDYRIPNNSKFSLMQPGILGEKFINVEYSSDKQYIRNKDTVKAIGSNYNTHPEGGTLTVDEIDTLAHRWAREIKKDIQHNRSEGNTGK